MRIARFIGLTFWAIALIAASATLFVYWRNRIIAAEALGYSGWIERFKAESAGFFDPGLYRQALWEKDREETSQRALEAHQAERRREQEHRANGPQYACLAAQMTIKERLKNTSDARFPSCLAFPGHVTTISATSWLVHSWVELPDTSGIYRQHGFEVSVDHDVPAKQYRAFVLTLR